MFSLRQEILFYDGTWYGRTRFTCLWRDKGFSESFGNAEDEAGRDDDEGQAGVESEVGDDGSEGDDAIDRGSEVVEENSDVWQQSEEQGDAGGEGDVRAVEDKRFEESCDDARCEDPHLGLERNRVFLEQQGEVVQDGVEGGPDNQQCSNAVAKVGDNDGRDEEDLHRLLSEKGDVHGVDHFDVDDSGCCVDGPDVGAIKVLRSVGVTHYKARCQLSEFGLSMEGL